jgi:metallo-beta-lactamase family protein
MATPSAAPALRVTFEGAARTVTGSMHLVEADSVKLLLDCGLFQGRRAEERARNCCFPFDPRAIDAVVLSHAHIDHSGNLPNLVRQGFSGPIYCTPATLDLLSVMLTDSAKIQEEDAAYLNRHREPGEPPIEPLYERRDVFRTVKLACAIPYDRPHDILPGIQARFVDAGHLLGSAMVALHLNVDGRKHTITFTGDLGRRGLPILRDPAPIPPAELLISESTYGGHTHPPADSLVDGLEQVVRRTAERGGKVLVPAFSVGRTQTVLYYLHQLMSAGRLAPLPIFVDSPLASAATEVFRLHPECFDDETAVLLQDDPDLFGQKRVHYIQSVEESKRLNAVRHPCVIIAASGMCESGRILHHLKHNIEDPRTTVLIIGFQAPETLGRRLVERRPQVRILNKMLQVRAEVVVMNGFSSHADQQDFLSFLGPLAGKVKAVRLVHGEMDRAQALADSLRAAGFPDVQIPEPGDAFTLE